MRLDAPEPMLMIRPKPWARIDGRAAVLVHQADVSDSTRVRSKAPPSSVNAIAAPDVAADVVHQNVDPAEAAQGLLDRPARIVAVGRVGDDGQPPSSPMPASASVASRSSAVRDEMTIVAPSAA